MKTNVLKSTVLFAALSLAFTACQKDSLVTEMETTKTEIKQIVPNDRNNDKEIDINKIPIRQDEKRLPENKPAEVKEYKSLENN